jgi:hypothetical protein
MSQNFDLFYMLIIIVIKPVCKLFVAVHNVWVKKCERITF